MKALIASVPGESQKISASDKKALDDAIKAFTGQGSVRAAEDGNWHVKGMKSTLKHYQVHHRRSELSTRIETLADPSVPRFGQVLGVAAMRKRENSTDEPKGGILVRISISDNSFGIC